MAIKAIILDVGGVILHEKDHTRRHAWETRLGLPQDALTRLVLGCEPAAQAAWGQVAESKVWQVVGNRLGLTSDQISELQRDFWSSEQPDLVFVEFLQSLRPRYKIGILSNAWSDARTFHNLRFKFDTWVDAAVYSAEVKICKPNPRIYQLVLDQLKLAADECVFVDDKLTNVQAAQSLGMAGVWYRQTRQAIDDINRNLTAKAQRAQRFF
jgi:epoxide hydrolase-like predicted phosphatase